MIDFLSFLIPVLAIVIFFTGLGGVLFTGDARWLILAMISGFFLYSLLK